MHYLANNKSSRHWINRALIHSIAITALALVTGCGGGGGGGGTTAPEPTPTPTTLQGKLIISVNGETGTRAIGNVSYSSTASARAAGTVTAQASGVTGLDGSFTYSSGGTVTFTLAGQTFTVTGASTVTAEILAAAQTSCDSSCQHTTANNIKLFLINADDDRSLTSNINLSTNFVLPSVTFEKEGFATALEAKLAADGRQLTPTFLPFLGINTEAPQSEQNNIVLPMPFVDIFRTARPFAEGSCKDVTYDQHGWPNVSPPTSCSSGQALIRTFLLNDVLQGMVPAGKYTILYEGDGKLAYSGYAKIANPSQGVVQGKDIIEITPPVTLATGTSAMNYMMLRVTSGTVKNIRIIMPGGICRGNPFVRVEKKEDCADPNNYVSFETTLAANRNAIVFNPDYLRFLKDFRVLRMMNLMQVSPSYLACAKPDPSYPTDPNKFERNADGQVILDQSCVVQPLLWDQRSKMDSAVWGASGNLSRLARYGKAAPIEVQVALANQLNAHPWFNIPHNATENYVREFARYVKANLNTNLKAHIEYSNETWNSNFWAYHYMLEKGITELGDNTAWRGANYYARQSRNVFHWWEDEFGGTQRLIRILATYQNDSNRTKRMLDYGDTKQYVDAIAMGAYFYACWENTNDKLQACYGSTKIPKPLVNATSVNDIFAAIDNPLDPYGMEGVKSQFTRQAAVAKDYGKALYAYEGGQHLTILGAIDQNRKQNMIDLMHAANQSPDMGERYKQLLESWKAVGGQTFMLFSVPHTFSQFGSFGIKTRLDQPRSSAPKYDAAMKFQETQGKCWWNGC
jgi:hypothetical protein